MQATLTLSLGGLDFTLTPSTTNGASVNFETVGSDYQLQLQNFSGTLCVSSSSSSVKPEEEDTTTTPKTTHVQKRKVETEAYSQEASKRIREELDKCDDVSVATEIVALEDEHQHNSTDNMHTNNVMNSIMNSPEASTASQDPTVHELESDPAALLEQPDFSQTQLSEDDEALVATIGQAVVTSANANATSSNTAIIKPARVSLGSSPAAKKGSAPPAPRWGHTLTAIDKNRLLVYGGQTLDATSKLPVTLDDVTIYDAAQQTWFQPFNCLGLARQWHTATYLPDRHLLISFGGEAIQGSKTVTESTVMVLDTEIMLWYPPTVTGTVPSSRSGHTATVLGRHELLVVIGGVKGQKWLNSVSVLDTTAWKWTAVKPVGSAPPPRSYHSAVAVGDHRVVVFGGNNAEKSFNSVHVLHKLPAVMDDKDSNDSTSWKWSHPTVSGTKPAPRTGHTATLLADGTTICVHGGWDPSNEDDDEEEKMYGDVWYLDTLHWAWRKVSSGKEEEEQPRVGHAAVLTENHNVAVFGGREPGDSFTADLDTLTLEA